MLNQNQNLVIIHQLNTVKVKLVYTVFRSFFFRSVVEYPKTHKTVHVPSIPCNSLSSVNYMTYVTFFILSSILITFKVVAHFVDGDIDAF